MKFSSLPAIALLCSACSADSTGTCSLGIARWFGSVTWDITIYDVPSAERQLVNVIATATQQTMDKGDSIEVDSTAGTITIMNVDNAPAFAYDNDTIVGDTGSPSSGETKVLLDFSLSTNNVTWTTDDCYAANVVQSGGLEGWSCDFNCTVEASAYKEL